MSLRGAKRRNNLIIYQLFIRFLPSVEMTKWEFSKPGLALSKKYEEKNVTIRVIFDLILPEAG
jgi:hypothetical protein